MAGFGTQAASAPYPATNYPAYSFFGPKALQPQGAIAETSITPQDKRHTLIALGVLIVVGVAAYMYNAK